VAQGVGLALLPRCPDLRRRNAARNIFAADNPCRCGCPHRCTARCVITCCPAGASCARCQGHKQCRDEQCFHVLTKTDQTALWIGLKWVNVGFSGCINLENAAARAVRARSGRPLIKGKCNSPLTAPKTVLTAAECSAAIRARDGTIEVAGHRPLC